MSPELVLWRHFFMVKRQMRAKSDGLLNRTSEESRFIIIA